MHTAQYVFFKRAFSCSLYCGALYESSLCRTGWFLPLTEPEPGPLWQRYEQRCVWGFQLPKLPRQRAGLRGAPPPWLAALGSRSAAPASPPQRGSGPPCGGQPPPPSTSRVVRREFASPISFFPFYLFICDHIPLFRAGRRWLPCRQPSESGEAGQTEPRTVLPAPALPPPPQRQPAPRRTHPHTHPPGSVFLRFPSAWSSRCTSPRPPDPRRWAARRESCNGLRGPIRPHRRGFSSPPPSAAVVWHGGEQRAALSCGLSSARGRRDCGEKAAGRPCLGLSVLGLGLGKAWGQLGLGLGKGWARVGASDHHKCAELPRGKLPAQLKQNPHPPHPVPPQPLAPHRLSSSILPWDLQPVLRNNMSFPSQFSSLLCDFLRDAPLSHCWTIFNRSKWIARFWSVLHWKGKVN